MSLNDGTGAAWDTASPADGDFVSVGAKEIRDERIGTGLRIAKEHIAPAAGTAGGEHKAGSAKAYIGTSDPTLRPDAATSLNSGDAGRLFANSSDGGLRFFDGTIWRYVQIVNASQIPAGFITSSMILDGTLLTADFGEGQVTTSKLADGLITTVKLGDLQITTGKIADAQITTAKIVDANVTLAKLASGLIPFSKIGTYTGNGSASPGNAITVGFKPDFIVICRSDNNVVLVANGAGSNPGRLSDAALGQGLGFDGAGAISFDTSGFTILTNNVDANQNTKTYLWFAIKCNP